MRPLIHRDYLGEVWFLDPFLCLAVTAFHAIVDGTGGDFLVDTPTRSTNFLSWKAVIRNLGEFHRTTSLTLAVKERIAADMHVVGMPELEVVMKPKTAAVGFHRKTFLLSLR
jgi:hypothetical protein